MKIGRDGRDREDKSHGREWIKERMQEREKGRRVGGDKFKPRKKF